MVVVEPPDSRGLRDISIGGTKVGSAWSLRDLRKVLARLGWPRDMDVEDRASVHWREADSGTWPDRAWRRRMAMALTMAGLLGSMALLAVVGSPDAVGALTFAGRLTGVLLMLLGGVQGLAALAARDYWGKRRWRLSGALVLTGAFIAWAFTTFLLVLWLQEKEYTHFLFACLPLWCWSVWVMWLLIRAEAWRGTPHPKKFAAGVAATTLLAAVNLSYSAVYQPVSAPVLFSLKAEFGEAWTDTELDMVHLPLILHVKNTGKIPGYIIGDHYWVRGLRAGLSDGTEGLSERRKAMEQGSGDVRLLFTRVPESDTISAGLFYGAGAWLAPGEEYSEEKLVLVPRSAGYDAIEAELTVEMMRKDRGTVDAEQFIVPHPSWRKDQGAFYCPPDKCGIEYVAYRARLRHGNNLINVTRRPVYVTSLWGMSPSDSSYTAFISSSPDFRPETVGHEIAAKDENKRERERYGVASFDTKTVVSFVELLKAPAA